jgi:hypothetical protein
VEPEDDRWAEAWLDRVIDRAGDVAPRTGLEARLVAAVRGERERRARRWQRGWRIAVATGAAAALATLVILQVRRAPEPGVRLAAHETPAPPARPVIDVEPSRVGSAAPPLRHVVRPAAPPANPRRERFPTPTPLSEQEQMLLRYVSQYRAQAVQVARARTELDARDLASQEAPPAPAQDEVEHGSEGETR